MGREVAVVAARTAAIDRDGQPLGVFLWQRYVLDWLSLGRRGRYHCGLTVSSVCSLDGLVYHHSSHFLLGLRG